MFEWNDLLLPILIAAVLVFIASSLIHTVIKWHNADYRKLSNEDQVRAAIRASNATPGQYILPGAKDSKEMCSPEMKQKMIDGPVGLIWLRPHGPVKMGPFLGKWFLYTIVVSALVSYVGWSVLPRGTEYLKVFQVIGATAWLAYSWEGPTDSIWAGKPWVVTLKNLFDGLIYASLTAGAFAWLWPR